MALMLVVDQWRGAGSNVVPLSDGRTATLPATDLSYWIVMLSAGTLGTALGDYVADEIGLGAGDGSLALIPVFALALFAALVFGRMTKPWYWIAIVAARTLGTTLGDFIAGRNGLALGLPVSMTCTGLLLIAILILWKSGRAKSVTA